MMAARLVPGGAIRFAEPAGLFRVPDGLLVPEAFYYTPWDVARDGRFLMARLVDGDLGGAGAFVVVENWIEEFKAKVK
jgi:hypothetical protein